MMQASRASLPLLLLLLTLSLLLCAFVASVSALPEEVVEALEAPGPLAPTTQPPIEEDMLVEHMDKMQRKIFLKRLRKKKVINLPSKGLQITLLPWKCYNQSSCKRRPVCKTSGSTRSCTVECYACHSCVQPKIIKKRQKSGKIKVTHKSYIRTHSCGSCYSHSECTVVPGKPACAMPNPCTLAKKKGMEKPPPPPATPEKK